MNRGVEEKLFFKNGQKSSLHCLREYISTPGVCTPAHYHKYIEILYGIDCDISLWVGDRFENFRTGDICFINPGETHYMFSEKETNEYYVIKFFPEILSYDGQMFSESRYIFPIICSSNDFKYIVHAEELGKENIDEIIKEIFFEWEKEKTGYEIAIRGEILKIFSILLRIWEKNMSDNALSVTYDENIRAIHKSIDYVTDNYDVVSEVQMATYLHMSYSHFSRTFKKVVGKSFSQFVNDTRLSEAKRLLLTTAYSVTDISQRTGFSSASHFISNFKKATGMTPNKYRGNLKIID